MKGKSGIKQTQHYETRVGGKRKGGKHQRTLFKMSFTSTTIPNIFFAMFLVVTDFREIQKNAEV